MRLLHCPSKDRNVAYCILKSSLWSFFILFAFWFELRLPPLRRNKIFPTTNTGGYMWRENECLRNWWIPPLHSGRALLCACARVLYQFKVCTFFTQFSRFSHNHNKVRSTTTTMKIFHFFLKRNVQLPHLFRKYITHFPLYGIPLSSALLKNAYYVDPLIAMLP